MLNTQFASAAKKPTVALLHKTYQGFVAKESPRSLPVKSISTEPLDRYLKADSALPNAVVTKDELHSMGWLGAHDGDLPLVKTVIPFLNKAGHTQVCYYAGLFGNTAMVESMLKYAMAKKGKEYTQDLAGVALQHAAEGGKLQTVQKVVELVPGVLNDKEACGWALHNAAVHNKDAGRAVIKYLFEKSPVLQSKSAYIKDWMGTKRSAFAEAQRVAYHRAPGSKEEALQEAIKTDKLINDLIRQYRPTAPRGGEFTRTSNFDNWAKRK